MRGRLGGDLGIGRMGQWEGWRFPGEELVGGSPGEELVVEGVGDLFHRGEWKGRDGMGRDGMGI